MSLIHHRPLKAQYVVFLFCFFTTSGCSFRRSNELNDGTCCQADGSIMFNVYGWEQTFMFFTITVVWSRLRLLKRQISSPEDIKEKEHLDYHTKRHLNVCW